MKFVKSGDGLGIWVQIQQPNLGGNKHSKSLSCIPVLSDVTGSVSWWRLGAFSAGISDHDGLAWHAAPWPWANGGWCRGRGWSMVWSKPKICEEIGSGLTFFTQFLDVWGLDIVEDSRWNRWISWSNLRYSPSFFLKISVDDWWVVSNMTWWFFHFIYGMSSFPLTYYNIFQDGHIAPPSSWCLWICRVPMISLINVSTFEPPTVSDLKDFCHPSGATVTTRNLEGRSKSDGQLHSACFGGAWWEGVGGCFGESRLLVLVKYVITKLQVYGEPRDQREMWHIRNTWGYK